MKSNFYRNKKRLSNNRQKNSAKTLLSQKIEEHIDRGNAYVYKEKIERLTYEQREWIRIRDERRCQLKINGCRENTKMPVQVHHIIPWDYAYYVLNWPKKWIDAPENTITLCYICHAMIHRNKIDIKKLVVNTIKSPFTAEEFTLKNPCWFTAFDQELREIALKRTNSYIIEHPNDPFPLPA